MVSRVEEYRYAKDLKNALTKAVVEKCENKRVLLTLTGGMDTRVLLAILLMNNISFDAVVVYLNNPNQQYFAKQDIKTARKLSQRYGFALKVLDGWFPWQGSLSEISDEYDVIISGDGFTECLCRYDSYRKGCHQRNEDEVTHFRWSEEYGYYTPIWEKEVQDVIKEIPMYRRIFSIPQREVIKLVMPELLRYGFTAFNFRRHTLSILYRFFVWSGII